MSTTLIASPQPEVDIKTLKAAPSTPLRQKAGLL